MEGKLALGAWDSHNSQTYAVDRSRIAQMLGSEAQRCNSDCLLLSSSSSLVVAARDYRRLQQCLLPCYRRFLTCTPILGSNQKLPSPPCCISLPAQDPSVLTSQHPHIPLSLRLHLLSLKKIMCVDDCERGLMQKQIKTTCNIGTSRKLVGAGGAG